MSAEENKKFRKIIVLGGGSAGFLAALALRAKVPSIPVTVIRSKDIGIIGVGEGSTISLTDFLHNYIKIDSRKFFETALPTWKLGLKFIWGTRPHFFYTFSAQQMDARFPQFPRAIGYYCERDMENAELYMAMMEHGRIFERAPNGLPQPHGFIAYHVENDYFVKFLEATAIERGIEIVEDTVAEVKQDENGVSGLALKSGRALSADLYVDCSGFFSLLLGKSLKEPYISFKSSLFCDRAVVGGWPRQGEPILPYTTCETMNSGWCWQIEHENRINRGYVYCSSFISDEEAEAEFRAKAPKAGPSRIVKFISGRYERAWVKNVVAIGNATGFVEPLEATALGAIAVQSRILADTLAEGDGQARKSLIDCYNTHHENYWDAIRGFIAIHYKFNGRLDNPFWRECREKTDLSVAAPLVEFYRENGPTGYWGPGILLHPADQFGVGGYITLLVGQRAPYQQPRMSDAEIQAFNIQRQKNRERALRAMTSEEALSLMRSEAWKWER
jgi:tryptophan halogenase